MNVTMKKFIILKAVKILHHRASIRALFCHFKVRWLKNQRTKEIEELLPKIFYKNLFNTKVIRADRDIKISSIMVPLLGR